MLFSGEESNFLLRSLYGRSKTIVVADDLVFLEVTEDFHATSPARQVVYYANAVPRLIGHQICDSAMLQLNTLCRSMVKTNDMSN